MTTTLRSVVEDAIGLFATSDTGQISLDSSGQFIKLRDHLRELADYFDSRVEEAPADRTQEEQFPISEELMETVLKVIKEPSPRAG